MAPEPPFARFATAWLDELAPALRPNTVLDYRWQLEHHLLPFFGAHGLAEITVAEVDRYRAEKLREGRLSATSINKTLTRLGQILDVADERELILRNPMRINPRRRKLRVPALRRSYLDRAEQLWALLEAAGQLDGETPRLRLAPDRAIIATLALAGLRIGELLALRWRDVDLAGAVLRVADAKTAAGVRELELLPALRAQLAALSPASRAGATLVFASASGRALNASNVRNRTLARCVRRADELLAARGAPPLPDGLTPHSLRRTYASLLFALGRTAPEVMATLGHTDSHLTLRVYARAMRASPAERDRLAALVAGAAWPRAGEHPVAAGGPAPGRAGSASPSAPALCARAGRTR